MQETITSHRYKLIRKLGEGGMGAVYHAHDRLTGQDVALKHVITSPTRLITNSSVQNPSNDPRLSLAHEFQTMASLRHPNVIAVQDYGFGRDGQPFFTMTMLENPQTVTKASENQPFQTKIDLTMQMLQALAYIHRRGVLHRDLKPSNVMVKDGHVYVVDFGLAQAQDAEHGGIAGTLAYMAPEILRGERATESSDLFALGIILYEMLANQHPFVKPNITESLGAILSLDPDWDAVDVELDVLWVLQRLLQKDPDDRYQNATDVINALNQATNIRLSTETIAIRESFLQAARFIGRSAELSQLIGALGQILSTTSTPTRADNTAPIGSQWLVGGESGVGKSRLLEEVRVRALIRGVMVVRGQAISSGGMPYQLWRDLLRRMVLGVNLDIENLSVLKTIIPDLPTLLEIAIPDFTQVNDPASYQKRLFGVVVELFKQTLSQHPILLIAEDLQWASESLALLKEVAQLTFDFPLMVIGVYRDDERPDLPEQLSNFEVLKLNRLSKEEIARLSQSILGDVGERPQVVDLLERETEGNVFFLVEVVRTLAEDAGGLADIGRATLPSQIFAGGIQQIVNHRLSRVPDWARDLLDAAAVVGRQIDLTILKAIAPQIDLEAWLTMCVNVAVLNVIEENYRFAHDKLREGVLMLLSAEQTRDLNRKVAEAIEVAYPNTLEDFAVPLAQHWQMAQNPQKEAHYTFIAAEQAQQAYSHTLARRLYERLLDMKAEQYATNPTQYLGKVYHGMGRACYGVSDYEGVRKWQTKALEMATQADDLYLIAEVEFALGEVDMRQSKYEQALHLTERAKESYAKLGNAKKVAYCLMSIGMIQARTGLLPDGTKTTEECLRMMRELGDEVAIARALNNYAICYDSAGEWDRALELYNESLAIRRKINDRAGLGYSLNNIGALLVDMKRHDEGLVMLMEGRKYMLAIGEKLSIASNAGGMGLAYYQIGQYEEARRWQMESLAMRKEIGDPAGMCSCYKDLAQLELIEDNPEAAWRWVAQIILLINQNEQLFLKYDTIFASHDIYKHTGAYEKALLVTIPVHRRALTENRPVDQMEKNIAELRDKLGEETYQTIVAKAENETVDSIIEMLRHDPNIVKNLQP